MCDNRENAMEKVVKTLGTKCVEKTQGFLMQIRCIVDKGMKKANPKLYVSLAA